MAKSNVKYRMGIALGLLIIIGIAVFFFYYRYPQETTIQQLLSNPQIYDGKTVKVYGLVVENTGSFWGERYDLYQDYYATDSHRTCPERCSNERDAICFVYM